MPSAAVEKRARAQQAALDAIPDSPGPAPKRKVRVGRPQTKAPAAAASTSRGIGPPPLYAPPPQWAEPKPPAPPEDAYASKLARQGIKPTVFQRNPLTGGVLYSVRHDTTVRRAHLRRLLDIAHLSLERGDVPRARRAWAIMSRCAETEGWWTDGLIRDLVDAPRGSIARKELISAGLSSKVERLRLVVLDHISNDDSRAALDELELYLSSDPYRSDAVLSFYAGCCALFLAQPMAGMRAATPMDVDSDSDTEGAQALSARLPNLNPTLASDARNHFRRAILLEREQNERIALEATQLEADGFEKPEYPQTRIEEFASRYLRLIDGKLDSLDDAVLSDGMGSPAPSDDEDEQSERTESEESEEADEDS